MLVWNLDLLSEALILLVQSSTFGHYLLLFPHVSGEDSRETDEAAKELEHVLFQNTMDKEMNELNKHLEQKEVLFLLFVDLFLNCIYNE